MFTIANIPNFLVLTFLHKMGGLASEFVLQHPNVKKLMESNLKFDVIITEIFCSEALLGFGQFYNAPVIAASTFGNSIWTNDLIGNPAPLSYVPNFLLSYTDRMTFSQRFHTAITSILEFFIVNFSGLPIQKSVYDKYFPDPKPDFYDVHKNVSLVFLNSHFSLITPRPLLPSMVEIGGIQIARAPRNALPKVK